MSTHNISTHTMSTDSIQEAQRQVTICNACRYCEGFCSVFPSLQQIRHFSEGDLTQLANLCHNCRACHYACQYSAPHEFNVNIPQSLAKVRVESWQRFARPRILANSFQQHGVLIGVLLIVVLTFFFYLVGSAPSHPESEGFYQYLSHTIMVLIFAPAFILPLTLCADALRQYWRHVGGEKIRIEHIRGAFKQIASMKNLAGGQGQGCNFEKEDAYSNARRYWHQATLLGFVLCFASTSTGTLLHYVANMPAPYAWYSLPKLLGVPGGLLLVAGCTGLGWLKCHADRTLGAAQVWGAEMAFIVVLGLSGLTGLSLYAATGTNVVSGLLAVHLACVMCLFLLLPYSKMVHGFFRLAALVRDEQTRVSR